MEDVELFRRLGVALAIGLLVGLERGWQSREEAEGERTAGIRTYALSGLLGGISGAISAAGYPLLLPAALVSFGGAFMLFHWLEATSEKDYSVTGVVAGLLTFMLGAYAVIGNATVAVAAAVAMTLLLALKAPLHTWLRGLTWLEIRAALILLAMTFLLLPVLPDRTVDPWGAINPASVWQLAILIAGVSFAGYVAIRILGDEGGIAVAAVTGGLTSSTATTLSLARMARDEPEASWLFAGGILLSGLTMMLRVLAIVGALNPKLIGDLALPILAGGAVQLAAGAFFLRRGRAATRPALGLSNPFDLAAVLKLAAVIAVIMVLAKIVSLYLGDSGIMALAAISGIADVDALSLSMSRMAGGEVMPAAAATAILIAVATNTLAKAAMTFWVGGRRIGLAVSAASGIAVLALLAARMLGPQTWLLDLGIGAPTSI